MASAEALPISYPCTVAAENGSLCALWARSITTEHAALLTGLTSLAVNMAIAASIEWVQKIEENPQAKKVIESARVKAAPV